MFPTFSKDGSQPMIGKILAGAVVAVALSLTSGGAHAADCGAPMDGLAPLLERPGVRYVFLGETHGTAETPELFGDIVCAASARPIVIGVEWPAENQPVLDAFLAEVDPVRALERLRKAPALKRPDGRGSRAMIDMLMRLWRLRHAGRQHVGLVAFDYEIPTPGTSNEREAEMAAAVQSAAEANPEALLLILTGMGHADREGFTSLQPPVRSMIQNLPAESSVSIAMARVGGEAWVCRREAAGETCSTGAIPARDPLTDRGISPGRAGFDAVASIGRPYTASPAGPDAHQD